MKRNADPAAPENGGVTYRRAKTWRIALSQLNSGASMCFYILMGYASYLANAGYGILTAVVGFILTGTRIFDAITDPLIALLIDKINTKHGKIRIMLLAGWAIESLAVFLLYVWASGKGHGVVLFILLYMLYVVGYTINNVAGQIIPPVLTNDPKQRPKVGVWSTVYNYFVPMLLSVVITMVILPKYSNEYTVPMLAESCIVAVGVSFVLVLLACVGVCAADKPENFAGISAAGDAAKVSVRDMWRVIRSNRPLQMYIASAASDKLAQQTGSQAIVTTMLFGILIGNIQLGTIMSIVSMLPSILFAILGARYAGKHGNKKALTVWTSVCVGIACVSILFCCLTDLSSIGGIVSAVTGGSAAGLGGAVVLAAAFVLLLLALNGSKMCVTTATSAMCADIVDYELERSGKFTPALVTATYMFVDKMISSIGAAVATGCVALIGYRTVMPQPTDPATTPVLFMTMFLYYGLPILGWICTLVAMRFYTLTKEKMVEVQGSIQEKKQQALAAQTEA